MSVVVYLGKYSTYVHGTPIIAFLRYLPEGKNWQRFQLKIWPLITEDHFNKTFTLINNMKLYLA
jgi:hypothetical protein